MKSTVLVTGGAGFIGSSIVDLLIEKDYEVVIVDNLSTGKKENVNKKAIFYQLDIRDPNLKEVFSKHKIDFISHQAAQANVRISIEDPLTDADINVKGFLAVMELARKFAVKKVVFASSVAVYGQALQIPISEEVRAAPISPYGVAKLTAEYYLNYYYKVQGIRYTALRYANVYGPRQDAKGEGGVVAIFTDKMVNAEQPLIFGDGQQTRDFVNVADVARANLLALESNQTGVFNIGTNKETSVDELFDMLKSITGFSGEKIHGPAVSGDILKSRLSCELAKEKLAWEAEVNFKTGLEHLLDF